MVVTCIFFRFVSFREPHRYSNLLRTQESLGIVYLTGPDTSHVILGNMFCTNTFVESLKETNKIETSYMSIPFKFTLLGLLGEQTVYKKQVNVISSNILEGRGRGKSGDRLL